ncbi:MAG: NAD(P)H-dependent oxidoreductase [Clostridia bacterium]|nr:NAD(P)H-dependent oxidoreductase [Clostridia bacterium]
MNILVINGSPKGKYSITLQTINYLERRFPDHNFNILNAGQSIRSIERNFTKSRDMLIEADAILFSYPVYTFIAPSQLHRFIELLKADGVDISGKFATQITTSKHFYDITAHKYIEDNCHDLKLRYVKGLSADMDDLLKEEGREVAEKFFAHFIWCCENGIFEKAPARTSAYSQVKATDRAATEKAKKDIVIITDNTDNSSNLAAMISRFRKACPYETRVVNIAEYPFQGGCLGCFNCAVSAKCVYKDNFDEFLRNNIQKADSIVYAFAVSDHSMGSRFKMYDDRNFCNGHRTVTVGMPVGYLVSGELSAEENLRNIIEARAEVGHNFLAGVATDEHNPDGEIDALALQLDYALKNKYVPSQNFWGIGGMKIFRDLIYKMQGMMRADHKFYKKGGYYKDFPQKDKGTIIKMYLVGSLLANDKIRKKMGNKMNDGMLMPYNKMFEKMDKNSK